jgi:hypothetical protein
VKYHNWDTLYIILPTKGCRCQSMRMKAENKLAEITKFKTKFF